MRRSRLFRRREASEALHMSDKTTQSEAADLNPEEFPDDIKQALNVIVGNRPQSFIEEFDRRLEKPEMNGSAFGGTSAQQEFIKKKDPVEKVVRFAENEVYVLDLTSPADKKTYSKVLDTVFDPESGVVLAEPLKDPTIIVDPHYKMGYRAIVTIKTARPEEYLKKKGASYSVVGKK